jgi:hypothetical protein
MGLLSKIFGGSKDNKSQTTNADQVGASEQGQVTTGASTAARDGGVALGANSRLNAGTDLSGLSNSGTITVNGNAGAMEIADQFSEVLNNLGTQTSQTVATALDKSAKLAEVKSSEGFSSVGKLAVIVAGIVALVFLVPKMFKRA